MATNTARVDATYLGAFAEPAFQLLPNWSRLCDQLFQHYSPWIRLDSIRWEGGPQPVDYLTTCNLVDVSAIAKFRLIDVELWQHSPTQLRDESVWMALIEGALATVRAIEPRLAIKTHTFGVGVHFRLEDTTFDRALQTWVKTTVKGFGAAGGSLVFLGEGPKVTVDLQESYLSRDSSVGLARVLCEVSGDVPIAEALPQSRQAFTNTLSALGLSV